MMQHAKIESTFLGPSDRADTLTFWLYLEYESGEKQGFGGYAISNPSMPDMISGILKAVGVECWEDLEGWYIRVVGDRGKLRGIGHEVEIWLQVFPNL